MKQLSLDRINAKTPYQVVWHKGTSYRFESDFGVKISIDFDLSDVLEKVTAYELSIINRTNKNSPHDVKMRDTILAIVEEFFHENQSALLYLCETGDNKQAMRARLFMVWFHRANAMGVYEIFSTSLKMRTDKTIMLL